MNPAMSSWVALRQRVQFQAGQNVLVLGATGNAGQMAVQIAKLFGADQIIAAGRGADRLAGLPALGATDTVLLEGDADTVAQRLGQAATDVDVVIDYLWGQPTAAAMVAIVTDRADRGKPLTWIEIGSVAGPTAPIPSAALRAARLQIVGSGKAPSAPAKSSPNCPHSPRRSRTEPSTSTRGPRHSPKSNKPGPTPPTRHSASFSPHSPENGRLSGGNAVQLGQLIIGKAQPSAGNVVAQVCDG